MRKLQILAALGLFLPLQAFATIYSWDAGTPDFLGAGVATNQQACSGGDVCADAISWNIGGTTVTAEAYDALLGSGTVNDTNRIVLWHDITPDVGGLGGAPANLLGNAGNDNNQLGESIHLTFSSPTFINALLFNGDHITFSGYIWVRGVDGAVTVIVIDDVLNNGILAIGAMVTELFIEPDFTFCGIACVDTVPWYLAGIDVPEPATLALLGLGLAGLGFSRRRKKV